MHEEGNGRPDALKLAMGQMLVEGAAVEANLARAEAAVAQAAALGCRVVVLPECLDVGWTHPTARNLGEPIPGPRTERLAAAAQSAGVYLAAGLTERAGDRIYNAAVLLGPDGALLLHHRKVYILEIARDLYTPGDRLGVAETPFGRVGLNICADNFPANLPLGRAMALMGARLLLSPSAWVVRADHDNAAEPYGALWRGAYTTLTTEHALTVVGTSNVGPIAAGPWRGRKCIGCSLAMGPGGRELAVGPYGERAEAVIPVDVPPPGRPAAPR